MAKRILTAALATFFFASSACAEQIPLERSGGVYTLPVLINNVITLQFVLDSGAAEVSIPIDVASTLSRAGTIDSRDFLEDGAYQQADGSVSKQPRLMIRRLRVGSFEITNVTASIGPISSPLLIGQSLLSKVQSWTIDNRHSVLVLNGRGNQTSTAHAMDAVSHSPSWTAVSVSADGGRSYIDVNSVDVVGNLRGFWFDHVFADGSYQLLNYSLHCGSSQVVLICGLKYTQNGSLARSDCPVRINYVISPNSILDYAKTTVCNMTTSGSSLASRK